MFTEYKSIHLHGLFQVLELYKLIIIIHIVSRPLCDVFD
jgi:hypothetical protein